MSRMSEHVANFILCEHRDSSTCCEFHHFIILMCFFAREFSRFIFVFFIKKLNKIFLSHLHDLLSLHYGYFKTLSTRGMHHAGGWLVRRGLFFWGINSDDILIHFFYTHFSKIHRASLARSNVHSSKISQMVTATLSQPFSSLFFP